MARSLLAKLSHSPIGSFKAGWILERVERTKRLIAKADTIYETLLGFVDSGCSPFTVDELNGIIREVDLVTDTVICPSVQQIDADLAALLASPPTLLGFVDSGCSPFTVDELNGIIREVDLVTDTVICPSVQQIDADLAALLASPPVDDDDHGSVPQSQLMIIIVATATATGGDGDGLRRREATPDEEVIGGAGGTQVQIMSRM
uniref:Uncharacterized protein n=1 Tax=Oryza meridionalis TaxID=40149 RepID=A0A0E0DXB7_9ORYZ